MFDHREKIALLMDGPNLYAASKALGFDIDYCKLLEAFRKRAYLLRGQLLRTFGRRPGNADDPPAHRLARLQWIPDGHQAGQRIHRHARATQN